MVRVRPDQQPTVAGVDRTVAVFRYAGPTRALLAALKFRANRAALGWLGGELEHARRRHGLDGTLTWAPTTAARARRRGFDQAALLARAARDARRSGADQGELRELLRRRPGPAQTGTVGRDRAHQVAFVARGPVPRHVLVVDDVVTTGSTLAAAAGALRAAGAERVDALVVAWTAPPGTPPAGEPAPIGRPPLPIVDRRP